MKAPVFEPARRDQAVKEQCRKVNGINDIRRALILREWRDQDPDERVASADRCNRAELARRFEQSVRDVLGQTDTPSKLAVLTMLEKMGTSAEV